MAQVDRLVDDLKWDETDPEHPTVLVADRPVASFERREHRVVTWLELLDGQRRVDVTVQPDTVVHLIRGLAVRHRRDGNAWERAVARRLGATSTRWELQATAAATESLAPTIASLGFPIVGLAMSRGVSAPSHIPRWAESILASPDVTTAARSAFGRRANRRVIRTLPSSLLGSGDDPRRSINLVPLAFGIALPEASSADVVANVLSAATADHAAQHWPDIDGMEHLRRGFDLLGQDVSVALASEAIGSIHGPTRLVELMKHVPLLLSLLDGPLPRRIADLETDVGEHLGRATLVPDAEDEADEPPPRPIERRVAAHRADRGIDLPAAPLYAPQAERALPAPDMRIGLANRSDQIVSQFHYSDRVQRLDGATNGVYSLCLPRSRAQLRAWGRELNNCMVDYCDHVAQNQSVILGFRRRGRLLAGVELTPDLSSVRQFVRDSNLRPLRAERDALRTMLDRLGVAGG